MVRTAVVSAALAGLIGAHALPRALPRTLAQPLAPSEEPRAASVPFRVGEKLSYQAKLNFVSAGSASMSVEGVEEIRGRPTYHTVFDVRGRLLFFHVTDHYESWFDTTSLVSLRYLKHMDESK
jgi:hypothetical protein